MKKRFSIRVRFITLLILLTVIPLIITGYILTKINERTIKLQIKESQLFLSVRLTDITKSILEDTCSELREIAGFLNDKNLSSSQAIRLAKYKLSNSSNINMVNIYNKRGDFIDSLISVDFVSGVNMPKKIDLSILNSLKDNKCIPNSVFVKNKKVFLEVFGVWENGSGTEGIFRTLNEITGLSYDLKRMIRENSVYGFDSAYILDKYFNIIAGTEDKKISEKSSSAINRAIKKFFKNKKIPNRNIGISFDLNYSGSDLLVNIDIIPRLNWILVSTQQKDTAYRSLYLMQRKIFFIAIIFIVIAVILGVFLGNHLSSPILKIAEGARKFARNDFSFRIKGINSKDEIGEVAGAFNFLGESLEEYDTKIKKEVAIRSDLSRYLAPELVEAVLERRADLSLGGKRGKIVVLFADIVGSTRITGSRPPEQVVSLLNELFTILTEIIFRNNGMVDKFIGDAVMALFGVPESDPDAVKNSVNTAREMLQWLEVGNKKWKKELGLTIKLSIAINYGEAIIGNIGSEKRMEFTAIGDVINSAAKIEKLALENQILITKSVFDNLDEKSGIRQAGIFKVPGIENEVELFEVL